MKLLGDQALKLLGRRSEDEGQAGDGGVDGARRVAVRCAA